MSYFRQIAGISNLGNTSGTSGVVIAGGVQNVLAGGNNITLSQSISGSSLTITISGPNTSSQSVESNTLGMSNLGNTSGTSGVISGGQVQFLFAGGNNITLSQSLDGSSGTITISAFNQSVQPNTEGTQTIGMSNIGNTSGTSGVATGTGIQFVFAGGNNITLSQSLNGSSGTITISAFTQSVQPEGTQTIGMSNLGNTSGTSGTATGTGVRFLFAGGNNITLSQSIDGASGTITISAFNQSAQPNTEGTQTLGMSNLGNTSGTSGVVTGTGVQLVLAGGNNVTLSQSINGSSGTITISAGAGGAGGSNTLGMSNLGNTSGTSGVVSGSAIRYLFAGGNNVTLSQSLDGSSGTVTISAFNQSVQPEGTQTIGMSNLGNTAGTSGVATGTGVQFVFAGGNNITLSQSLNGSSGTITISGGAGGAAGTQTFGMSNLGNTSGTSGVVTGTGIQFVLAGGNNITLSQSINGSSGTITISAPAGGAGGDATLSEFIPFPFITGSAFSSHQPASWWFNAMDLPTPVSFSNIGVVKSITIATATSSNSSGRQSYSYSHGITIFRRVDYGANSLSLTTVTTASFGLSASRSHTSNNNSISYAWVTNTTGGTSSVSSGAANTSAQQYFSGNRMLLIPCITSLSAGEYWIAHRHSSTTATVGSNATLMSLSNLHFSWQNQTVRPAGDRTVGASVYNIGAIMGDGNASAVTTAAAMAASVVTNQSNCQWWLQFRNC